MAEKLQAALEKEARNRDQLIRLFDGTRGGEEAYPNDVVMLHATSVESLAQLVKGGVLPGRSFKTARHKRGDLFVYPRVDYFPNKEKPSSWVRSHSSPETVPTRDDIVKYAKLIAERHYLLSVLEIPPKDINRVRAVDELLRGITPEKIKDEEIRDAMKIVIEDAGGEGAFARLLVAARQRQGVIIGIKRSALEKHGFAIGDKGEADFKLVTGRKGLSIDDIGSVEVLGLDGYDFFESLRNK